MTNKFKRADKYIAKNVKWDAKKAPPKGKGS